MQIFYTTPNQVWLKYNNGWYLVTARDGPVEDWEIAIATYYINRYEYMEDEDSPEFRLVLRHIFFDDTHGAVHLDFDLLSDVRAGLLGIALDRLHSLDKQLSEQLEIVDWHGQGSSYGLKLQRAIFASDHFTMYGEDWFKRFLPFKEKANVQPSV